MDIIETSVFTEQINQLLDDMTYSAFKAHLATYPSDGLVIKHGRGLRKIRWKKKNTGKRYGIRIIYLKQKTKIYLLHAYDKKNKKDINRKQIEELANLVDELR